MDDIKEPKKPKKPKSLIDTAYMRAHASEIALEKMYSSLGLASNASRLSIPVLPNTMYTNLKYIFVSDNRVDVELKNGIVHTKDDFFQGVYIVPLKEGSYSVKVTIMCAEYREPDIKYIGVICKQTSDGSDIVTLD